LICNERQGIEHHFKNNTLSSNCVLIKAPKHDEVVTYCSKTCVDIGVHQNVSVVKSDRFFASEKWMYMSRGVV